MAQNWGFGLIETRGEVKLAKLEKSMDGALGELSCSQVYKGAAPPEEEDPEEQLLSVELLDNGEGILAVRLDHKNEQFVRDLARLVSQALNMPVLMMVTIASLFHRRRVQVKCRKFAIEGTEIEEQTVMGHHDADISDLEHNELRQQQNAMRSRLNDVVESFTRAEGTAGFKIKKVFRYKHEVKKAKFSSPRLARLMTSLERCEAFEVVVEGEQHIVRVEQAGAVALSYVKPDEVAEIEKALESRPQLQRRRKSE